VSPDIELLGGHIPVFLHEVLSQASIAFAENKVNNFLDLTLGGGGHFVSILTSKKNISATGVDCDPRAIDRVAKLLEKNNLLAKSNLVLSNFSEYQPNEKFNFIMADLGISSFQIDDQSSGMSWRSKAKVDFRMDPTSGIDFFQWLDNQTEDQLKFYLQEYGEERKATIVARKLKNVDHDLIQTTDKLASFIAGSLRYNTRSRKHPATKSFQALRIAVNKEMDSLENMLEHIPSCLSPGGRFAVISFHSVEDRIIKYKFRDYAKKPEYNLINKKVIKPTKEELDRNPRARSAKLRVIERVV